MRSKIFQSHHWNILSSYLSIKIMIYTFAKENFCFVVRPWARDSVGLLIQWVTELYDECVHSILSRRSSFCVPEIHLYRCWFNGHVSFASNLGYQLTIFSFQISYLSRYQMFLLHVTNKNKKKTKKPTIGAIKSK